MTYTSPYIAPTLTVDAVIMRLGEQGLEVLLHRRPQEPFAGEWALPGGYCAEGQTTIDALRQVVERKTGASLDNGVRHLEQLYTFDTVARDPRGHAVSVVYMALGTNIIYDSERCDAQFWPVTALPNLAYDHDEIVAMAQRRLAGKVQYTNIVFSLLPAAFTLSELQTAYEAMLGRELDKRNFRKKILSLDIVHETGDMRRDGAHRPAKLYAFTHASLVALAREF